MKVVILSREGAWLKPGGLPLLLSSMPNTPPDPRHAPSHQLPELADQIDKVIRFLLPENGHHPVERHVAAHVDEVVVVGRAGGLKSRCSPVELDPKANGQGMHEEVPVVHVIYVVPRIQ